MGNHEKSNFFVTLQDLVQTIEKKLSTYPVGVRRVLLLCYCTTVLVFQELDEVKSTEAMEENRDAEASTNNEENIKFKNIDIIPFDAARILWQELLELEPEGYQHTAKDLSTDMKDLIFSKWVKNFCFQVSPWKIFISEEDYAEFKKVALNYKPPRDNVHKNHCLERFFQDIGKKLLGFPEITESSTIISFIRDKLRELGLINFVYYSPLEQDVENELKIKGFCEKKLQSRSDFSTSTSVTSASSYLNDSEREKSNLHQNEHELEESEGNFFIQIKSRLHREYGMKLFFTPIIQNGFQFLSFTITFRFLNEVMASACLRHRQRLEKIFSKELNVNHKRRNSLKNPPRISHTDGALIFMLRLLPSLMMRAQRTSDAIVLLESPFFLEERILILQIKEATIRTQLDHKELRIRNSRYEKGMMKSFFLVKKTLFDYPLSKDGEEDKKRIIIACISEFSIALDEAGYTHNAIKLCYETVKYAKTRLPPNNFLIAETLRLLGKLYLEVDEIENGIKALTEALEIETFHLGPYKYNFACACEKLALLHDKIGNYDHAVLYYEEALISHIHLRKNRKHIAELYCSLGHIHKTAREYEKTVSCYEKALSFRVNRDNEFDSEAAQIYFDIGNIYFKQKSYGRAIKQYMKSLDLEDDSDAASKTLFSMGVALFYTKNQDNGLVCFEQALDIQRERDNEATVEKLFSTAEFLCDRGQYELSIKYCTEAESYITKFFDSKREYIDLLSSITDIALSKKVKAENKIKAEKGEKKEDYGNKEKGEKAEKKEDFGKKEQREKVEKKEDFVKKKETDKPERKEDLKKKEKAEKKKKKNEKSETKDKAEKKEKKENIEIKDKAEKAEKNEDLGKKEKEEKAKTKDKVNKKETKNEES